MPAVREPDQQGTDSVIDLSWYLRVVVRRRWAMLGALVTCIVGMTLHTLRQPKIYAATTSVIIDATPPKFLENNQVQEVVDNGSSPYWFNKEYYETQYKVITSRAVATRVVEKLALHNDAEFLGLQHIPDPEQRRKAMAGADAPGILQTKIRVTPVKESRVVYVVVEDRDPKRAALLSNEVAEAYITENLALKLRLTESASEWLDERLASLEQKVKQSETAIYDFKKDADVLSTSLEDRQNIISQRLTSLNNSLTEVRTKIAGIRARVESMEAFARADGKTIDEWAEDLRSNENGLVNSLRTELARRRAECEELNERYLAEHPTIVACREKLHAIRQDLRKEVKALIVAARFQLEEAKRTEQNLDAMLSETKAEAFKVNKRQIDFERLKRQADNDQRLYDLVLRRLKDIELSGMLRTSNVRVLDAARPVFSPVRPNLKKNLLLALAIGLVAAVGIAFALEMLDTRITMHEHVESWLGVTFLGILPRFAGGAKVPGAELAALSQSKSALAECCRSIRTNLLFMSPDRPLRTMLITSSGPQDGKTTTAVSLATTLADSGNRVLLVDADMRRPRVHHVFGVPNGSGLTSLILGEATLADTVRSTQVPGLSVVTCGPLPPNPAELLHTEAFARLLVQLAGEFDRVIIDSPPIGAVADAVVISTKVDGAIIVLKANKTSRPVAMRTIRSLHDVNARIFGAVLNDVDATAGGYGYYYQYKYTYGERVGDPTTEKA